jgi:membrane-anchored mycosin MYCP
VGVAKLAGLAVVGSVGLASLVTVPVALATTPSVEATAKPAPTTKRPTRKPTSAKPTPAPTVTKTKLKTVAPPQRCDFPPGAPASQMTSEPWPQQMLDFTDVWPLTQGEHVKVAIVDSGVDTSHNQLPSIDTYDETGTDKQDCAGHGTMLAGIIAAQDRRSKHVPFLGVAPKVHLISIKVATQDKNNDPVLLAKGIRRAAALGAEVICVSSTTANYPYLKSAVDDAQRAGALIVAAAGNTTQDKKASEQELYPASYNGVMSVGAVGRDGKVEDFSDSKSRVSIVAPGKAVISTWPGSTYYANDGTSFSAPYVAGTAALVKSYHPNLTAEQIKHRIEATADGGTSVGSGHGMVNPLRAVTAVLPEEAGQGQPTAKAQPVALVKPPHQDPFTRTMALSLVGGALGVAGAVAAGGIIIPAGRRRNWRPGRRTTSGQRAETD